MVPRLHLDDRAEHRDCVDIGKLGLEHERAWRAQRSQWHADIMLRRSTDDASGRDLRSGQSTGEQTGNEGQRTDADNP